MIKEHEKSFTRNKPLKMQYFLSVWTVDLAIVLNVIPLNVVEVFCSVPG